MEQQINIVFLQLGETLHVVKWSGDPASAPTNIWVAPAHLCILVYKRDYLLPHFKYTSNTEKY